MDINYARLAYNLSVLEHRTAEKNLTKARQEMVARAMKLEDVELEIIYSKRAKQAASSSF